VVARLTESAQYGHAWSTPELAAIFEERHRLQSWLDILAALARCQADLGLVPAQAADDIAAHARADDLDLSLVAERTRATSHSTLGLIEGLALLLPERSREFVYYGITVQDLTDSWFGLVMRDVGALVRADLVRAHAACLALATAHRDLPMAGRTHGQPGSPITFGLKAATWADEIGRSIDRLDEGAPRWSVVQLAGSTGTLAFFGDRGPELRARLAGALGLSDPGVSWTSTRDRVAEFGFVLALVCGALARIGNEVYELARPEIGELAEPSGSAVVGSITMPHKRNPEISEHLDTLARLARASSAVLLEGVVSAHERDGRGWKAEWAALPEVSLLTGRATSLAVALLEGLEVDGAAMRRNLGEGSRWASERILVELSGRLGKHRAQALLQELLSDRSPRQAATDIASAAGVPVELVLTWMSEPDTASAAAMVDTVVARGTDPGPR
jgi:adenylosuccinate lyase